MFRQCFENNKEFHSYLFKAKILLNAAVDNFKNHKDYISLYKDIRHKYYLTFRRSEEFKIGYIRTCGPLLRLINSLGTEYDLLIRLSYRSPEIINNLKDKSPNIELAKKAALEECLHFFYQEVKKVYNEKIGKDSIRLLTIWSKNGK